MPKVRYDYWDGRIIELQKEIKYKCNFSTIYRKNMFGWYGLFLVNDISKFVISLYTSKKKFNKNLYNKCRRNGYTYLTLNLTTGFSKDLIDSLKDIKEEYNDWIKNKSDELERTLPKSEVWFRNKINKEWFFNDLKLKFNEPFKSFIYDVYSPIYSLVIEIDGSFHDSKKQKEKDHIRDTITKSWGLRVIRIKAYDEDSYSNGIKQIIEYLKGPIIHGKRNIILRKNKDNYVR